MSAGGNFLVYKCNLNITIVCIYLSVFEGLTCYLYPSSSQLCQGKFRGGACFHLSAGFLNVTRALDLEELTLQHFYGLDLVCEVCSPDVSLFL